jgi:predicted NAD/FAD-dependent oxidoreductase
MHLVLSSPRADADTPLACVAWVSSKPGRLAPTCWVAQAGPAWSAAHLELTSEALAARMVPMLCEQIGTMANAVRYAAVQRWH